MGSATIFHKNHKDGKEEARPGNFTSYSDSALGGRGEVGRKKERELVG